MENSNYKSKSIETKYLKKYAKESIFKDKEYSLRIRKRFYRQKIK